jgi:hypothetical protein
MMRGYHSFNSRICQESCVYQKKSLLKSEVHSPDWSFLFALLPFLGREFD